ncbi:MAG: DUF202 domain-containing protein [Actinobacteria bacterium]|nr:DUF202 domain-containing protein [Actinomycetota bacterium]
MPDSGPLGPAGRPPPGTASRGQPPRVADPGLQSERTYLAWQRTGLTFAAVGTLLVHRAIQAGAPLAFLPGGLGLAVAALILLRALLRYRVITAAARGQRDAASPRAAAALAVIATIMGVTALVVVLAT